MEYYRNRKDDKQYLVESVGYCGAEVTINGSTITDCGLMCTVIGNPFLVEGEYSVVKDNTEKIFKSFDEAYTYATTKE